MMKDGPIFATMSLPVAPDTIAPDGSEIRLLPVLAGGSMVHCTLPPGATSRAVAHRSVEEIWFVTRGAGQVWRGRGHRGEVVDVAPGVALTIPLGTRFQFRNSGTVDLELVIVTMPPWPGDDEAVRVADYWPVVEA